MLNFEKIKKGKFEAVKSGVERLTSFLSTLEVKVLLNQALNYNFAGQCEYSDLTIKIGRIPEDQILLTLCHEAGHLLSHLHRPHYGLKATTFEREFWAYLYGWTTIKWLKLEVTKEAWRLFHEKELLAYLEFKQRTKS